MKQTCGMCAWGVFEMSKHAKPRPLDKAGKCGFMVNVELISKMIPRATFRRSLLIEEISIYSSVWPGDTDCPCWEPGQ